MANTGFYGNKARAKQTGGQGKSGDIPLYVVFQTAGNPGLLRLVRGGPSVFTQYQSEMIRANQAWLDEMRGAVLENIQSRLLRPAVSTGRLLKVTGDKGNEIFDQTNRIFGFSFGIPRFLAGSISKYWRTVEEGSEVVWSHPFVGMPIPGLWGGTISGFYANRWGNVARAGAPFTQAGRGSGGKLRALGAQQRAAILDPPKVRHEIPPMRAYADAWNEHVNGRRFMDVWKTAFTGGKIPSRRLQLFDAPTRGPRRAR